MREQYKQRASSALKAANQQVEALKLELAERLAAVSAVQPSEPPVVMQPTQSQGCQLQQVIDRNCALQAAVNTHAATVDNLQRTISQQRDALAKYEQQATAVTTNDRQPCWKCQEREQAPDQHGSGGTKADAAAVEEGAKHEHRSPDPSNRSWRESHHGSVRTEHSLQAAQSPQLSVLKQRVRDQTNRIQVMWLIVAN